MATRAVATRLGLPLTLTSEWVIKYLPVERNGAVGPHVLRDVSVNLDTSALRAMFPLYLGGTLSGSFDRIEIEQAGRDRRRAPYIFKMPSGPRTAATYPGDYRIDVAGNAGSADGLWVRSSLKWRAGADGDSASRWTPMRSSSVRPARWPETTVFGGSIDVGDASLPRALTLCCRGSCEVVIGCDLT